MTAHRTRASRWTPRGDQRICCRLLLAERTLGRVDLGHCIVLKIANSASGAHKGANGVR